MKTLDSIIVENRSTKKFAISNYDIHLNLNRIALKQDYAI